uniref:Transposable element P transposase n=1 Tax=Strigamia maritima TaxID=126957 RepID=T1IMX2_STRMM
MPGLVCLDQDAWPAELAEPAGYTRISTPGPLFFPNSDEPDHPIESDHINISNVGHDTQKHEMDANELEADVDMHFRTQGTQSDLTQEQLIEIQNKAIYLDIISPLWQQTICNLQNTVNTLKINLDKVYQAIKKVFTDGQIHQLLHASTRYKWTAVDIASAISLRSISTKAYRFAYDTKNIIPFHFLMHQFLHFRFLRAKLLHPLPALSTLKKWAQKISVKPGLLEDVLLLMKLKQQQLNVLERLTFDEVYICNKICFDKEYEKILGPHKTCQVVMARGLCGSWKQPLYYAYDSPMKANVLQLIISELYKCGYTVVAVTCDVGEDNQGLWKSLNIGYGPKKKILLHIQVTMKKKFSFLLMNNLLSHGFDINGIHYDKEILGDLLKINSTDVNITYKLTAKHLDVKGSQKRRVGLAAQLLSKSIASAIDYCSAKGYLKNPNYVQFVYFINTVKDWFDVFNTTGKYGSTSESNKNAFGVNMPEQCITQQMLNSVVIENKPYLDVDYTPEEEIIMGSDNEIFTITEKDLSEVNLDLLEFFGEQEVCNHLEQEGLKYIAGYACFRFRVKYPDLGDYTKDLEPSNLAWVMYISQGGLIYRGKKIMYVVNILNAEFVKYHGKFFSKEDNVVKNVYDLTVKKLPKSENFPKEVLLCLVRTLTCIRIKKLNLSMAAELGRDHNREIHNREIHLAFLKLILTSNCQSARTHQKTSLRLRRLIHKQPHQDWLQV